MPLYIYKSKFHTNRNAFDAFVVIANFRSLLAAKSKRCKKHDEYTIDCNRINMLNASTLCDHDMASNTHT